MVDNSERKLQISPLYMDSIVQNKTSVQFVRNVTSLAIGIGAGIMRLESYFGFLFYLLASTIVSLLLHVVVAKSKPNEYFMSPLNDIWLDDVLSGLSSFVLTWTLFYGLVDV